MPLTPDFDALQSIDPNAFSIEDTSTGSDVAITNRKIQLQEADGTYLVPDGISGNYITFPLSDGNTISLDVLNVDYALSITVFWLDINGNTLYSKVKSFCFTENDEQFMYGLVQNVAANRSILQDTNFVMNCFTISMFVDYATKSVETGNDIASSQQLLDFAQNMINNQNDFF